MSVTEIKKQFIDSYVTLAKQQAEAMWPIYEQVYNSYPKDTNKELIDEEFMRMINSVVTDLKAAGESFTEALNKRVKENKHE